MTISIEAPRSQRKFVIIVSILQGLFILLYCLFVRYSKEADPRSRPPENTTDYHSIEELNIQDTYTMIIDIQVMLFVGFGFLMTFLRRFGYSAVCFTMLIIVVCVEWTVLLFGFTRMEDGYIKVGWIEFLEGGFAAATVLISFGVVLGKTSPNQLLVMSIIECGLFVGNSYIGYNILGALDIGGAIFIHTFGAYFGLCVSLMDRKRDYNNKRSSDRSQSDHTSDLFSILGTLMLLIYWPSFNGVLALSGEGKHRATLNTYISLCASGVTTFLFSAFLGDDMKLNIVDAQNAVLSGGVAVGAIADLVLHPYGALIIGSCAGMLSTIGYQIVQGALQNSLNLHDSCGVHNLHGMPGVFSGLLSAVFCGLASEEIYGESLYVYFPSLTRDKETFWISDQVTAQLSALGITLAVAIFGGIITGIIVNNDWLFNRLDDSQLFEDGYFFNLSDADKVKLEDEKNAVELETKIVASSDPEPTLNQLAATDLFYKPVHRSASRNNSTAILNEAETSQTVMDSNWELDPRQLEVQNNTNNNAATLENGGRRFSTPVLIDEVGTASRKTQNFEAWKDN